MVMTEGENLADAEQKWQSPWFQLKQLWLLKIKEKEDLNQSRVSNKSLHAECTIA